MLFSASAWLDNEDKAGKTGAPIVITAGDVNWLRQTFSNQWLRPPSNEELHGLIGDLLNEELLAREAEDMSLAVNDTIIRRRLAQKLKFLVDDTAQLVEPKDDELHRYYLAHAADFAEVARISFTQVYFDPASHRDLTSDIENALRTLQNDPTVDNAEDLGDRLLIDGKYENIDQQSVSSLLGPDFAKAAFAAAPGRWIGPLKSGYGLHLIFVSQEMPAAQRPFDQVRDQVLKAWQREKQDKAQDEFLARLRDKYEIRFDDDVKALLQGASAATLATK